MAAKECEAFAELLSDLADGDLEGADAARTEAHVAGCSACAAELALLRGVVANLVKIPEEDVPPVLAMRVMDAVRQPSFADRMIALLAAPFSPGFLRFSLSAAALVTLAVCGRALFSTDGHPSGDQFASVPVWWGGNVLVNELPHPPMQSGKLGLRPGDSVRTGDKVEVTMQLREAQIEVKPRSNLILSRSGLSLVEGEVVVRVDEAHAGIPEDQALKITTPNAIIIHVGTVFKVDVTRGSTRTEVSQGRVKVYSTSGAAQELSAGQVAQLDDRGLTTSPAVEAPALRPPRTGPEEIRSITQSLPGGPARQ